MEAHLAQCPECAAELASIRSLSQLMGRLPEMALPRSFALTEAVLTRASAHLRRPGYGVWTGTFATAAAAVMLVFLLVGDAMGLVTQSPTQVERFQTQEFSAPAAPAAPAPAPPIAALRSASETVQPGDPGLPAPAAPAASAPAAPAAPAPIAAPAPEVSSASVAEESGTPGEASASLELEPAAAGAAPATAMTVEGTPPAETDVSQAMGLAAIEPETAATAADGELEKAESSLQQSDAAAVSQDMADSQPESAPAPADAGQPEPSDGGTRAAAQPPLVQDATTEETAAISLPVRQLQVALTAAFVVLLTTTFAIYRRRRLR